MKRLGNFGFDQHELASNSSEVVPDIFPDFSIASPRTDSITVNSSSSSSHIRRKYTHTHTPNMFARRGGDRKRRRGSAPGGGGEGGGSGDVRGGRAAKSTSNTVSRIFSSFTSYSATSGTTPYQEQNKQPLRGVVACLSGYTSSEKEELHELIEYLGGRYTRDFSLDGNTHLITEAPQGAKYDLAASSAVNDDNGDSDKDGHESRKIYIVTRSWLEACATSKSGTKASESDHKLLLHSDDDLIGQRHLTLQQFLSMLDNEFSTKKGNKSRTGLFSCLQFYLLGFQEDQNQVHPPDQLRQFRNKLSTLIRRAGGTIYWELKQDVNIFILCDGCDDILNKAAEVLSTHHPHLPPSVSPLWIMESWKHGYLLPPDEYRPNCVLPATVHAQQEQKQQNDESCFIDQSTQHAPAPSKPMTTVAVGRKSLSSTGKSSVSASSSSSQLTVFRGSLFTMVRIPPQYGHDDVLDYDLNEQETFVRAHGGQVLSQEILAALRADLQAKKQQRRESMKDNHDNAENRKKNSVPGWGLQQRRCYVVCWGDADGPPRLEMNHLLSQAQREGLLDVAVVTPVWLKTCVDVRKCVRTDRLPMILQPQPWPFRTLIPRDHPQKKKNQASHTKTTAALATKQKSGNASKAGSNDEKFDDIGHHKSSKRQKKDKISPSNSINDVRISLTGFQGTEKIALVHLIDDIGGTYHDNMSPTNTHLICKEKAVGLKRQKAIEWNIKVVSIDWLYHVLQYGINGENPDDHGDGSDGANNGCEYRFSGL